MLLRAVVFALLSIAPLCAMNKKRTINLVTLEGQENEYVVTPQIQETFLKRSKNINNIIANKSDDYKKLYLHWLDCKMEIRKKKQEREEKNNNKGERVLLNNQEIIFSKTSLLESSVSDLQQFTVNQEIDCLQRKMRILESHMQWVDARDKQERIFVAEGLVMLMDSDNAPKDTSPF